MEGAPWMLSISVGEVGIAAYCRAPDAVRDAAPGRLCSLCGGTPFGQRTESPPPGRSGDTHGRGDERVLSMCAPSAALG